MIDAFARALTWTHAFETQCWSLLAQVDAEFASTPGDATSPDAVPVDMAPVNPLLQFFTNPLNLILLSAILFMFIVVRPQQKQAKDLQKALDDLKKNDRVILASGIHGTVVQANSGEAAISIRIDENSGARMTVNRESVAKVLTESKENND